MSRMKDAASQARQQHEKPVDDNDMVPNMESETPAAEHADDPAPPEESGTAPKL